MQAADRQLYEDLGSLKTATAANTKAIVDLSEKMDRSFELLKTEIRNMSVVSRAEWEKRNASVDIKLSDFDTRLASLESGQMIEKHSLFYQLRQALAARIVTIVVALIVAGTLILIVKLSQPEVFGIFH